MYPVYICIFLHESADDYATKCNQPRPGFELMLPCLFPATITITPRAPSYMTTHSIQPFDVCARGVVVIIVGNGHDDTGSNTGRDWLHFT